MAERQRRAALLRRQAEVERLVVGLDDDAEAGVERPRVGQTHAENGAFGRGRLERLVHEQKAAVARQQVFQLEPG